MYIRIKILEKNEINVQITIFLIEELVILLEHLSDKCLFYSDFKK